MTGKAERPAYETGLAGRTAFITGAAAGLGAQIAAALHSAGATVVLSDIDPRVMQTAQAIGGADGRALGLIFDVSDEQAFSHGFAQAVDQVGGIDVMVNNAAVTAQASIWDLSLAQWDRVIAVNLRGCFLGCRIAGAHLRDRGWGRIINLGSYAGQQASRASGVHYAASKAGILAVTRAFAMELAPHGVTVNTVAPSMIDGPQWQAVAAERRAELLTQVPLGRAGRAEEVAAAVCFLASPAAGYLTGITLDINGGRAMR